MLPCGFHNIYLLFGCSAITLKLPKGSKDGVCGHLLGLSIPYGSHATIITLYVYKDTWLWLKPFNGFDSVVLWTDLHLGQKSLFYVMNELSYMKLFFLAGFWWHGTRCHPQKSASNWSYCQVRLDCFNLWKNLTDHA